MQKEKRHFAIYNVVSARQWAFPSKGRREERGTLSVLVTFRSGCLLPLLANVWNGG